MAKNEPVKTLPMEQISRLGIDAITKVLKFTVDLQKQVTEDSDAHRESFTAAAKYVCALKSFFNKAISAGAFPSSLTFGEYFTNLTKGKLNNHIESCAKAFASFVDTGKISERDYDDNPAANLEKASAVVTAVCGDLAHEVVGKAAEILRRRPKDAVKLLKALKDTVQPPDPMDEAKARGLVTQVARDGHIELAVHVLVAEMSDVDDDKKLERFASALQLGLDRCTEGMEPDELLTAMAKRIFAQNPETAFLAVQAATDAIVSKLTEEQVHEFSQLVPALAQ